MGEVQFGVDCTHTSHLFVYRLPLQVGDFRLFIGRRFYLHRLVDLAADCRQGWD